MALSSYTVTNWSTGDIITAAKLNKIEAQVSALTKVFITDSTSDRYVASTTAWGVVKIADNNNLSISNTGILNLTPSPSYTNITASGAGNFGSITTSGSATINTNLTVTNKLTINSSSITLSLPTTINNTLIASNTTTLNGALTVNAATVLNSTLNVTGLSTFDTIEADSVSSDTIIANKFTLAETPAEYALLDLVPSQYVANYVTDTVPSWARASTKPTYTATEISNFGGYVKPSTGIPATDLAANVIPSNISAFTNDTGYLVASDIANLDVLSEIATSGEYKDLINSPVIVGQTLEENENYSSINLVAAPKMGGSYYLTVEEQEVNDNTILTYVWSNMANWPTEEGDYNLRVTISQGIPTYSWIKVTNGGE